MKNSSSIQFKIAIVYIILFGAALFSGAYIFREVQRLTLPEQNVLEESNKIFLISSTIANLYASEASSRSAILSGNNQEISHYQKQIDSIKEQINTIKIDLDDPYIMQKMDTVQQLLEKKKKSFSEIVNFRKQMKSSENYDIALNEIYLIKDEIEKKHSPIVETTEAKRRSLWARLGQAFRAENPDTVKTTINYPKVTDSLINAMEKIFAEAQRKEDQLQRQLVQKEQSLLIENKNLTDQLRTILESVERNILTTAYKKINESKAIIGNATNNIAWIGGSALITVIILGWIILKDLNQTQKYRLELEKLNEEKEVLLRSKAMLLATVTHDIQTPLGSVLGFTELLEQTPLNPKQDRYVKNIQSSSQYIVKLVNDLVDFSKLENNKLNISENPFNFLELINATCYPLIPNATNKKIKLEWDIDPKLNDFFVSDSERIKQVLTNLITNAIKFTQEGGVSIHTEVKNDRVYIRVSDTGIGIATAQLDHIFMEFKQAHEGIEKKFGGTGLGLNISKRIMALLGGDIYVESELGKGSVFTMELPLHKAKTDSTPFSSQYISNLDLLKQNTVIVIDDDKLQLQLMEEVFTPIFKRVYTLDDASDIKHFLETNPVDLILTDMQMPKIDGFELINILKNNAFFASIPVVALSGKRDLTHEDFLELGFTSSHPKPVQIQILIRELLQILYPDLTDDASEIEVHIPKDPPASTTDNQPYSTEGLIQFIGNDREAMRNILSTFVESTEENLLDLKYAAEDFDRETLGNIAHKMLPMFRQLQINKVVSLLLPLEDLSLAFDTKEALLTYISGIEQKTTTVLSQIKDIELS